jgi:hypothetical protein
VASQSCAVLLAVAAGKCIYQNKVLTKAFLPVLETLAKAVSQSLSVKTPRQLVPFSAAAKEFCAPNAVSPKNAMMQLYCSTGCALRHNRGSDGYIFESFAPYCSCWSCIDALSALGS